MSNTYSDLKEIKFGVLQGSVRGALLFIVFVNDIFLYVRCTNADDPTLETITRKLETDDTLIAKWFSDNY